MKLQRHLGSCIECNQQIEKNQSYYYCSAEECFWHKICLKNKLSFEEDCKDSAGYTTKGNKKPKCKCGTKLLTHNNKTDKMKKGLKIIGTVACCAIVLL